MSAQPTHCLASPLAANWKQKGISAVLLKSYHHRNIQHSHRIFLNTAQHSSSNSVFLFLFFVSVTQTQKMSVFIFCLWSNVPFFLVSGCIFFIGCLFIYLFLFLLLPYLSPDGLFFFSIKVSLIQTHFNPFHCLTVQIRHFGFSLAFV